MNKKYQLLFFVVLFLSLWCSSCSKKDNTPSTPPEKLPAPYTDPPDSITALSAHFAGGFFGTGGSNFSEAGFCWGTDSLPTLSDSHVEVALSGGSVFTKITGLDESTTYHVRTYAKNSAGLGYGDSRAFTTLTLKPIVQISDVFFLSSNFASIDCKIISQGNSSIIASGICWSTNPNPTISDDTTKGAQSSGEFVPDMTGLKVNTKYYVRAYATNSDGTGYSDTVSVVPAYYIGEKSGGGKIFYIDQTKVHGLIAAIDDLSLGFPWDNNLSAEWTYAWSDDDGASNTDNIISTEGNGGNAASICRNYRGGGYSDWFLPSIFQLSDLFKAKDKIGNLTPYYYWSSTEDFNNISFAWTVRMDTPTGEQSTRLKSEADVVRAVRAF